MAWYRTGDKPLPEPMLTQITAAYICGTRGSQLEGTNLCENQSTKLYIPENEFENGCYFIHIPISYSRAMSWPFLFGQNEILYQCFTLHCSYFLANQTKSIFGDAFSTNEMLFTRGRVVVWRIPGGQIVHQNLVMINGALRWCWNILDRKLKVCHIACIESNVASYVTGTWIYIFWSAK